MRLQTERNHRIEHGMTELLKETREIKEHLMQYNYHMRMDTADITPFFPLETDDDVLNFLKQDEEWNQRRKASLHDVPELHKIKHY